MLFDAGGDAYGRFMGRFSEPLAAVFVDHLGIAPPQRALDIGAGAGALTRVLRSRLGASQVSAIEPSEPFVAWLATELPDVDSRQGTAESLPYDDDSYDAVLAQLVVNFMSDPVQGVGEMARVARPGGVVAVNVWDHAGGSGPLSPFWRLAREADPAAPDESNLIGARDGDLVRVLGDAGLGGAVQSRLTVVAPYSGFEEWWSTYLLGIGPAGAYVASLDDDKRERLRQHCAKAFPETPFTVSATAWTAAAVVR